MNRPSKNKLHALFFYVILIFGFQSCIVSMTSYMHDARVLPKNEGQVYLVAGTGVKPDTYKPYPDSSVGKSTGNFDIMPVIGIIGRYQAGNRGSLLGGIFVPINLGSLGWRAGYQHSIYSSPHFALAAGATVGYVFTLDSIHSIGISGDSYVKNFYHGDIFLPITFSFNERTAITITPRYSYGSFQFKEENMLRNSIRSIRWGGKSVSAGMHIGRFLVEGTWYLDTPSPWQVGIGFWPFKK